MGGDHGHGHGPPYKIPDFKIYKVEDVPELMATRRALASEGLKDPWLRNYVWKYDVKNRSHQQLFQRTVGRGLVYGFIAAVITTGIGYMIPDEHHGHGHGEEAHH